MGTAHCAAGLVTAAEKKAPAATTKAAPQASSKPPSKELKQNRWQIENYAAGQQVRPRTLALVLVMADQLATVEASALAHMQHSRLFKTLHYHPHTRLEATAASACALLLQAHAHEQNKLASSVVSSCALLQVELAADETKREHTVYVANCADCVVQARCSASAAPH